MPLHLVHVKGLPYFELNIADLQTLIVYQEGAIELPCQIRHEIKEDLFAFLIVDLKSNIVL